VTRILGLSGSLRAASLNSMLLRAAARLAPDGVEVELGAELGALPLFNPDLVPVDPPAVARLRRRIIAADALLIASPEYAHGVSGVLKNALDWMVGNESFVGKPVALLNAAPRANIAEAALRETLATMSASVIEAACIGVPLLGSRLDEDALVADPVLGGSLGRALASLAAAAESVRRQS
jgi:chromate reductase